MKHKILFYQVLFALIGLSYAKAQSQSDLDYTPKFTNRRVVEKNNIRYQEAILNGEKIILTTEGTLTSNLLDVLKQDESLKGLIKDTDLKHFLKINDLSADVKLAAGDIIRLKMKPDVSREISHYLLRGQSLWEIAFTSQRFE